MRTVVVTQYKKLEYLPPVMALLQTLKAIGANVIYVGVHSDAGAQFLTKNGIEHYFMPGFNQKLYFSHGLLSKLTNRIRRAAAFYPHRSWFRSILDRLDHEHAGMVIWHSEVISAALLGDWGLRFPRRLLTIYELADFKGASWLGFSLRKCLHNVRLVVPEYNRARILQEYFRLKHVPFVLPNKPWWHPRTKKLPLLSAEERVFKQIDGRPVFLYQGVWTPDREDVSQVLEVIARERPNYCIVSLPGCPAVGALSRNYKNVFSLPQISAPDHLRVTSWATVGIAIYNASGTNLLQRLNAVYCAPNKIYEYTGFGVPVLCNDMPGMKMIEDAGAGICMASLTANDILSAADELVKKQTSYCEASNKFYESTNLEELVANILRGFDNRPDSNS